MDATKSAFWLLCLPASTFACTPEQTRPEDLRGTIDVDSAQAVETVVAHEGLTANRERWTVTTYFRERGGHLVRLSSTKPDVLDGTFIAWVSGDSVTILPSESRTRR